MSTRELYTKGARIWIPDQELVWKAAEVLNDFKGQILEIEYEDGQKETLSIESSEKLPPLRNPEILIGENDLTSLSYLHEPAVLYNLQVRFCNHNVIYTYCGIVLVAINPYEELPIYGNDTISAYHGQAMGDLDPHIFAVAEEAYTQMERENQNQSIIVSGESGAGKTVSAKYAMRYFATVGGSATETQIEKKVLASNPIMEAIGNAKTTRNDNSSRFGKYIEIDFNHRYHITGANMRTYLLEKSRVVFQAPEERNYHIFYQLCASADLEELQDLQLGDQTNFHYTNQGDSPIIAGIDDARNLQETRNALKLLGFSEVQQMSIFRILSAVLHLGNVVVIRGGDLQEDTECSKVCEDDPHLLATSELLGINLSQFCTWICNRKIQSMREIIMKPMTQDQAVFARDALAKHIYSSLFDWIVTLINKSLASNDKLHRFIGVLDIYGFETFEINSFEQFCINYANEKLQQQFNLHVFKLEQEEYIREKIEWKFIDFYDNQPCIDLIESKLGILDLLDEECKMPKGTDETWCQKLYQQCCKWKQFEKPRLSNAAFIIHHFADNVKYDVIGFLDKNRDNVMEEHIDILRNSEFELVAKLFEEIKVKRKGIAQIHAAKPAPKSSNKQHRKTVGSQFHDSLALLMATLNATTPHYIRCIKPNDEKAAFMFEPHRAIQQLRACGVLETVRISAAGYPSRWTYLDFLNRYRVLTHSKAIDRIDMRSTCQRILENVIKEEDTFQFGKTKIFFRAGQVAYLEKLRADKLRSCAVMIQKHIRGWQQKNRYQKIHKTIVGLQCYGRGLMARRHAQFLRETKAAIIIQKYIRSFLCQQKYCYLRRIALGIQAHSRGMWARQRFQFLRCSIASVVIQKHVRGWLCRQKYKSMIRHIILLQSCVRRWRAKRELKTLKIEAKSVEHMKKLNKGLENKIISLQQKIEEIVRENKAFKLREEGVKNLTSYAEKAKGMEAELKISKKRITELEEKLKILNFELEQNSEEKKDLISEKDLLIRNKDEVIKSLNTDNKRLKEDINRMNELIKANEKGADEQLKTRVDSEKRLLLEEFSAERASYQKLLKENARLEQRLENLQNELLHNKNSGHHRTSSNLSLLSIRSDTTEIVQDDVSDVPDEDIGYGSVRSKDKDAEYIKLDDIRWTQILSTKDDSAGETVNEPNEEKKNKSDIPLILKLQQKLKNTETQKANLEKKVERLQAKEEKSLKDQNIIRDVIQIQELEMENSKLREEMNRLRMLLTSNDNSNQAKELLNQFECLQEELERRREECIQLRSIFANQSLDLRSVAQDFYGGNVDLINEDGELLMAFETQKKLIWQLESELQDEKSKSNLSETELRHEIQRLREDNERQQRLLSQNLKKSPQAQTEAILQHEINRLTGENVDLREKIDNLAERIKKLKKQLKIYAKQLKENEAGQEIKPSEILKAKNDSMPVIKHKDVDYTGMFEYRKEDESQIIKILITDLKPKAAVTLLPGLSAYVLFMCIRHTDYINDDEKVRSLLNNTIFAIKRVIKKKHEELEYTILWLANTCRLLHNLKQYSGDKAFQISNASKQNEQCLKNFDLSEYRQVLSDVAVWIYQAVIKIMEEKVQPLIVPAILEHEGIPGISGKPSGMRGRTSSAAREMESYIDPQKAPSMLLEELNVVLKILSIHGVDPELISQVFKQLFYFICAGALNNLLLRKDMCHWSKGMQIRYNLSCLEQWCRDQKIQYNEATETLAPVIQASQLLQARKTEADVQSICDMCNRLTTSQIVKILNLYTPADEFEERVPISFIRKIQLYLQQKDTSITQASPSQGTLLMDTKFAFPIRFPFNPSSIQLEDIVIPDCLHLPMLKKV